MKDSALLVYDWTGTLKTKVSAIAIRSREDARRLGPFADMQGERQVLWRRPSFSLLTKRLRRRSHFAYYPDRSSPPSVAQLNEEVTAEVNAEVKAKGESQRHRKAVAAVVSALRDSIKRSMHLKWAYRDKRLTYPFRGNLLADAVDAQANLRIKTKSGQTFYVDVAVLGPTINREPLVVGAIEVEFTHEFGIAKCLLLRSIGFPLFSVDVSETNETEITEEWASKVLAETTWNSTDERRRNYIYLNGVLAPVFLDAGKSDFRNPAHQFLVFASDDDLDKLNKWLHFAAKKLGIGKFDFYTTRVNAKSESARRNVDNAGEIAGEGWQEMNPDSYLLVQLMRPTKLRGPLYQLHLLLARLVSSEIDAIVGYRCYGLAQGDGVWNLYDKPSAEVLGTMVPFLPAQVSYPASWVLNKLAGLSR